MGKWRRAKKIQWEWGGGGWNKTLENHHPQIDFYRFLLCAIVFIGSRKIHTTEIWYTKITNNKQPREMFNTYANKFDRAAFGLHSWSVVWRCRRQKFILHWPQCTGTSSFFLHPRNEHLLVKIFVLLDLQYWSMCWPTVMSGDMPRGVGTGSEHSGHTGTCTSFLCTDVHLCFW